MAPKLERPLVQEGARRRLIRGAVTLFAIVALLSQLCTTALGQAAWWLPRVSVKTIRAATQNHIDARLLEPGKPIERELAADQTHYYVFRLGAGQYTRLIVERRSIDVGASIFGADGKKLVEFNETARSDATGGSIPISVVADASGSYSAEVRSLYKDPPSGKYQISIEELRDATSQDEKRVSAERAFLAGKELSARETEESVRTAIKKFEEALSLWRAIGDRRGEACALNGIGLGSSTFSEWQKVLDSFNLALSIIREVNDRKWEARLLHNIAEVYHALSETQKAIELHSQSLQIRREISDRTGEAYSLSDLGSVFEGTGDLQKALDFSNEALQIHHEVGDLSGEAYTLNSLGTIYGDLGETQKALDCLNKSLPLRRVTSSREGEAYNLNNIGWVYYTLGETRKAIDSYSEALPLFRAVGDRFGEAFILGNMGNAYRVLGDMQKAIDFFNQALEIRQAVGDRQQEAYTLNGMGLAYYSLGEIPKALLFFERALQYGRDVGDHKIEARILNNIGLIYWSLGEKHKALEFYNQSLRLSREVGVRSGEAATLYQSAIALRDMGDSTEARSQIEAALKIVESLRTKIDIQELRATYLASVQKYYESYIDLLLRMHALRPSEGFDAAALQVSERARARSLLELLAETRAEIRQGVDPNLLERERSLQQLLNDRAKRQTQLLNGKHTDVQAAAAAKEIESLTIKFQQVETEIRQTSPRYAALTQPQPLSVQEIQKQVLDPDTLLLEYSLGDERSYLWVVTPTTITSHELPGRQEVEKAARRVYSLLTARQPFPGETSLQQVARVAEADAQYRQEAAHLSQMLLGPVASLLAKKRLLIVADGALQYLPFAALPEPAISQLSPVTGKKTSNGQPATDQYQPLIVEHEIVNLPSASVLALLRSELVGRSPAAKLVAVLADPVFDKDDVRVRRSGKAHMVDAQIKGSRRETRTGTEALLSSRSAATPDLQPSTQAQESEIGRAVKEMRAFRSGEILYRLFSSRQEAEAIVAAAPEGQSLKALDFNASRAMATSAEMGRYRIVHFATHGLLNSEHPELSGLVLSLVDEHGQPQDGFLRLHEIYNLKLPAELVVLSACQTGLGKEIKGEGLVGLVRGFMYAGAPRVLASLWEVDDVATQELMKRFYKGMLGEKRLRVAESLRAAQVAMWKHKQWQSPYYWAAFELQGEWR